MADRKLLFRLSFKNPWHLAAIGFGSGLFPKAPGTAGSLAALPLCMLLVYAPLCLQLVIILLAFIVGTKACSEAEKAMGVHDHGGIVIDEFVGMFIAVVAFPAVWWSALPAFVFFRFFDILKPFPVGYADRKVKGGLGIMVDDVLAGLYALLCGQLLWWAVL